MNETMQWKLLLQTNFSKSWPTLWKFAKIGTDDRYNKVKKSTKFWSNADIFDVDMMSSNFWRHVG